MKALLNRKLLLMVLGPVLRAVLSAVTGYLTAKGVPADMVGEVTNAFSAAAILVFNVGWELVERRKVADKAVGNYKAFQQTAYVPFDEVRDRFERESG